MLPRGLIFWRIIVHSSLIIRFKFQNDVAHTAFTLQDLVAPTAHQSFATVVLDRLRSRSRNGWLENLLADHAAGDSVETLAARHRLPVDYIRATLTEPLEAAAVDAVEEAES